MTWYNNALFDSGLILLSVGALTGNLFLMLLSVAPLLTFLIGSSLSPPKGIEFKRELPNRKIHVGDKIPVRTEIKLKSGIGLVELHTDIPEVFEVVKGSNLNFVKKDHDELSTNLEFAFRCTRRGTYMIPPTIYESTQIFGMRPRKQGELGQEEELEVLPRVARVRRVRDLRRMASTLFPDEDKAKIGIETTDFREIRNYRWGDSPKRVNWKATAKRLQVSDQETPLVNEYEREGRKVVWVLLDCRQEMGAGTNVENSFEYAVAASLTIAQFFLDRGYKVGASTFNNPTPDILYPDVGQKQFLKISQEFQDLMPSQKGPNLEIAVQKCKAFLIREKPLVFVLTTLKTTPESLMRGLKSIRNTTGKRKPRRSGGSSVVLMDLIPYSLYPQEGLKKDSLFLARAKHKGKATSIRKMGITTIQWDPARSSFVTTLMRGGKVIARRA